MSYNPENPNGQATSANSSPVVIASDQSAVPVSGTVGVTANSSVNVNQVAGTAVDTNSGVKSAGTQRVVIATDQPQLTNALKVDGSAVTQPVSGTVTVQQSTASNLKIDLSGTAANTTALKVDGSAVTQPVSGTVTANMGTTNGLALDASVTGLQVAQGSTTTGQKGGLALGAVTTAAPAYTTAQTSPLSLDTTGNLRTSVGNTVTVGTHAVTQSGTWTVQPGNTANTTSWNMNLAPSATGGWSVSSQTNLTTTATVSAAAGKFGGYMFINLNSTPAYIQVFDTTGAVTLGTTTPTFVVPIPANSTAANGAGANLELTNGIAIASGIKVAATTTATGSTTVTTGLTGFVLYK